MLDAKVIRPFVAQGVQSQTLQKPILVIVITGVWLADWLTFPGPACSAVNKCGLSMLSFSQHG
jgi:hypothetical protein